MDVNLLYGINFIEEYDNNNNHYYSNCGINAPPKCPKHVMGARLTYYTLDNTWWYMWQSSYNMPWPKVSVTKAFVIGLFVMLSSTSAFAQAMDQWMNYHVTYDQKIIELINLLIVDANILIHIKMIHNFINGLHPS